MEWGDKIDFLTGVERDTGETPQALLSRPVLTQLEQPMFDAYQALSSSRNWTPVGPAAIPFSEISRYLEFNGILDLDEREEYIRIIQAIDSEYLTYINKKREKPK